MENAARREQRLHEEKSDGQREILQDTVTCAGGARESALGMQCVFLGVRLLLEADGEFRRLVLLALLALIRLQEHLAEITATKNKQTNSCERAEKEPENARTYLELHFFAVSAAEQKISAPPLKPGWLMA
ncbi:hypothetical protein SRHO_G00063080 [Serrasalmus rhombeus]